MRARLFAVLAPAVALAASCGGGSSGATASIDPTSPSEPGPGPAAPPPDAPSGGADAGAGADAEPPPRPYRHYDVNHVLSTGQSNAVANGGKPPLSTTQPYANLMFSSGVMPMHGCSEQGCTTYDPPTAFVPLVEGDTFYYPVETMSAGLANEVSKLFAAKYASVDAHHDVLVTLHGRSGHTYWCLRKGGCDFKSQGVVLAFDQGMMEVKDAMALAKSEGKSYVVRAVTAVHGEGDHYMFKDGNVEYPLPGTDGKSTIRNYGDALLEWQRDYEDGVRAITGQAEAVPLLISQYSHWNDGVPHSPIPAWQLGAHVRAHGKVVVVSPTYFLEYGPDCLHFTSESERHLGEYFAKAYARIVVEGRDFEPVRPKSVSLDGNVVTVTFYVPSPPLVFDTTRVHDPGDYGFEYTDDSGAPPAITSVAIAGPDAVKVTLARAPVGANKHLTYAWTAAPHGCPGPLEGPRGNLRDSDATPSQQGYELFDWAVHFDEPIP